MSDREYEDLLQRRIIVLNQQISDDLANRVAAQIILLAAEDVSADISLYINSPGGSVDAGIRIIDTMDFVPCDIATYATGLVGGMAQIVLSAGTLGKRYVHSHSQIVMLQPSGGIGGTESDIAILAQRFRNYTKEISELTARHTGQTVKRILNDWDQTRVFDARSAKNYGFVDHILP